MTTIAESNGVKWFLKKEDRRELNTREIDRFCELPEEKYMNILRNHRDNSENSDKEKLLPAARKVYHHYRKRRWLLYGVKDLVPESDRTKIRACLFNSEYSSLAHLGFELIQQLHE